MNSDIYDGFSVCTDCAMFIGNGETPPELDENETEAWLASLDDSGIWVLTGGPEEEPWFSSSPCDCCRSGLGGDRIAAAILVPAGAARVVWRRVR